MDIFGYTSEWGAEAGSTLAAHVSSTAGDWRARVVALDDDAAEAATAERWGGPLELGAHAGREQRIVTGSCVVVPRPPSLAGRSFVVQLWLWPTLPADGRAQGLVACCDASRARGFRLGLTPEGRVEATLGCEGGIARAVAERPLLAHAWHRLTLVVDPAAARVRLLQRAISPWIAREEAVEAPLPGVLRPHDGPLVMAASACSAQAPAGGPAFVLDDPFDGKLARPWIGAGDAPPGDALQRALDRDGLAALDAGDAIAAWDLGAAHDAVVRDRGPAAAHGFTVNHPASAVTGPAWRGAEVDFRHLPAEYDALHFHADDLDDARWQEDLRIEIPRGCASGLYGLALAAEHGQDVIPFVVRPPAGTGTAPTAVLLPTYTWQAYANQRWSPAEDYALEHLSLLDEYAVQPGDRRLDAHPELGLSLYDFHRDGSPCRYSSRLRPVANLRPDHRHRHNGLAREFAGDVRFLRWLRARRRAVDLLTDEDLHREGVRLFDPYRVVVTGSHPEYVTCDMRDALEEHVTGSGRFVYLGGNGYYWVTGVDERQPHVIEVRRGTGGTGPTGDSPPGESHLSTTGEPGGIWRHRGRAPQTVVAVGTRGMGWGASGGYVWTEASAASEVAFVTDGVDRDRPLGAGTDAFPWGAAADEIDCADERLGTPPGALLLATSAGRHDHRFERLREDSAYGAEGEVAVMRADVVYAESPAGGRLFSVGSMGWSTALWHMPDVERVTENVLDEFLNT